MFILSVIVWQFEYLLGSLFQKVRIYFVSLYRLYYFFKGVCFLFLVLTVRIICL